MDAAHRFRLSIRLEASSRALQDQWFKQVAVWAIGYLEVLALGPIPGIHLVTSPYITVAALLLMYFLACVRAGDAFDPLLWPVHVVRPRDHSRFGLGQHQKAACGFFAISTLIRLACSVSFAYLMTNLLMNGVDLQAECGYELWNEVNASRYASKLSACNMNSQGSLSCNSIVLYNERCHNATRWSSWLLQQAWEKAHLPCDGNATYSNESLEEFLLWLRSDWFENEYCETLAGTEILCHSIQEPYAILFTEGQMSLERICPSWPFDGLSYRYWCYSHVLDAEHCRDDADAPDAPDATWAKEELSATCASQECIRSIPAWMAEILGFTGQTEFCKCQSCKPWWNANQCMVEMVNDEYRLRAGLPEMDYNSLISLDFYWKDPTYSVQLIVSMLMVFGTWLWLLSLACFSLVGNAMAMPPNLELQQRVLEEEHVIAEELRSTGTVIQRSLPFACAGIEAHLNRLMMLVELGFYVVDFVLDFEMLWLYLHKQHYWFATVQGCIVARSVVDFLVRHVFFGPCFIKEIVDSFKANLRTDVFLTILQNEKTGEATLSFLLQVYALFYMGNELLAYWTALFSLLISARGIAQGCYIHFDLAIVCQSSSGGISRSASVVPKDGESETDVVAISVLPTPEASCGPPESTHGPGLVASPADGPPMMSLHDEDPEENQKEADCNGTVCAVLENRAGENMQQTETNDAPPAMIGKGVSVIVPL